MTKSNGLSDQVVTKSNDRSDQVTPAQDQILEQASEPRTLAELAAAVGWSHKTYFREKVLKPLIEAGLLSMTIPDHPRSRLQRYVTLTRKEG